MCGKFFDSKRDLKEHIDRSHRISNHMTASSGEAQRIAQDILSYSDEVLSVAVIDRDGGVLAGESRESFKKRFEPGSLDESRHSGPLAIATLSVVNEVEATFGEPEAIITIHKSCKLMLLPMPSYDVLIGLVLERSADADAEKLPKEIERLIAHTLKPQ